MHSPAQRARLISIGLLLLSFALNLQLLDRFPLREDEALYSYWALHLRQEDPWLLTVWPDKPPLFLWAQALVFQFVGATQATARLLNIGITVTTAALLIATSRRLWATPGLLAAVLYVLNPFALSFAATAYTDPLLVFWGQLALYLALSRRDLGAGMALGAAIMTKQQGLLYVPLVFALSLLAVPPLPTVKQSVKQPPIVTTRTKSVLRLVSGLLFITGPILYWDSQRWAVAPSPWDLSVRHYGGLALADATLWPERARAWAGLLWYVGGNWLGWAHYALLALLTLVALWPRSRPGNHQARPRLAPLLLAGWSVGFLVVHLITTVQIWDRYLLPLLPIIVLLLEPAVANRARIGSFGKPKFAAVVACVLLTILLPGGLRAARGEVPLGGDHGAYSGLTEAVTWLTSERSTSDAHLPFLLYQQPFGWQLQFYLYDATRNDAVEVRWFANEVTLADNAAKSPAQRRFLLQPQWQSTPALALHLATRNLQITARKHFGMLTLFEIQNRPQPPCPWCLCTPATAQPQSTEHPLWSTFPTPPSLPSVATMRNAGNRSE
ncbi:MAG: glycosyltransferase family 39 protein [Caldilineaceae bacterium]|nr:glycosyltransferase family 39 protein [Caldilineaceae bacterium]